MLYIQHTTTAVLYVGAEKKALAASSALHKLPIIGNDTIAIIIFIFKGQPDWLHTAHSAHIQPGRSIRHPTTMRCDAMQGRGAQQGSKSVLECAVLHIIKTMRNTRNAVAAICGWMAATSRSPLRQMPQIERCSTRLTTICPFSPVISPAVAAV